MQMVRQLAPILFIMLYSLMNISVYSHVHTDVHNFKHCESEHHHEHDNHDSHDSCNLCYFLSVPQVTEIVSQDNIPLPISFEIASYDSIYNSHQTQTYTYQSTNKDPPMFA